MKKRLKFMAAMITLVISLPLLYYGLWIYRFNYANKAFRKGDYQQAMHYYQTAEAMLNRFQFLKHLPKLKDNYQQLVLNQVKVLYAEGRYDEVLKKLEESLKEARYLDFSPEFHFWVGNALFHKTTAEEKLDEVIEGMQLAMDRYLKALKLAPHDWDLKYNYELTKKLVMERLDMKKKLELLKEIQRRMKEEERKLPAEKAG